MLPGNEKAPKALKLNRKNFDRCRNTDARLSFLEVYLTVYINMTGENLRIWDQLFSYTGTDVNYAG